MRKNATISKILKLKDNRKKELELEVKKASDRLDKEESKLRALEKEYKDILKFFNEKHAEGSLDAGNLISCYEFFSRINGKIKEQKRIHAQRKNELQALKNTLVNAHKDKKAFEILNEKALKREHRKRMLSEQKEFDFLAISRRIK
jgi:flagellar export protein FliJ